MCNPAILMLAATAVSSYGQYEQGQYQEAVGETNALIQDRLARDAVKRGDIEASNVRQRTAQVKSEQIAQMGASGLSLSYGNPVDILADTAEFGELDALTTENNALREGFGYQVSSMNSSTQASLDALKGNYGASGTLLSGGAKAWQAHETA